MRDFLRVVKNIFWGKWEKRGFRVLVLFMKGFTSEQVRKGTKGETNAENEQETETRMVAVPEPPGTALLQQLVQALRQQL